MFPAGTVFLWKNFPEPRDPMSPHKDRWFICLGTSSPALVPVIAYLCTTTTKTKLYQAGADRCGHPHMAIHPRESCFPEESVIDLQINFYDDITEAQLTACAGNIEVKGQLREDLIRRLYKLICVSGNISPIVRRDIHQGFNSAGVVGLRKP